MLSFDDYIEAKHRLHMRLVLTTCPHSYWPLGGQWRMRMYMDSALPALRANRAAHLASRGGRVGISIPSLSLSVLRRICLNGAVSVNAAPSSSYTTTCCGVRCPGALVRRCHCSLGSAGKQPMDPIEAIRGVLRKGCEWAMVASSRVSMSTDKAFDLEAYVVERAGFAGARRLSMGHCGRAA